MIRGLHWFVGIGMERKSWLRFLARGAGFTHPSLIVMVLNIKNGTCHRKLIKLDDECSTVIFFKRIRN